MGIPSSAITATTPIPSRGSSCSSGSTLPHSSDYYAARPLPLPPRPLPALYAPLPTADETGRVYEQLSGDARAAAPAVGRQDSNNNNNDAACVKAGKTKKLALNELPALK